MKLIDLNAQNRLSEAKDLIFKKLEEKISKEGILKIVGILN